MESRFLFTVCQAGAEAALKRELAEKHPDLAFAFSRPGFVTFRRAEGAPPLPPDFDPGAVFARAWGVSRGKGGAAEAAALARAAGGMPLLHVWEREGFLPGDEPPGFERGKAAAAAEAAIRAAAPGLFADTSEACEGDLVVDVALVDGGPWWLGIHRHRAGRSRWPGGRAPLALPPEAPSRAWLKLEEALDWTGAPVRAGDVAVELGSAPGGAAWALLQRGLRVVGIDPAEMDPRVLAHPAFTHLRSPVAGVPRESLPPEVHWLLLDMNVAPSVSVFAVDRLATRLRDSLLGLVLTVKLNEWKTARELPHILEHVAAMGMAKVRAVQLAQHRQELLVYGLSRKGLARGSRSVK
jgi:23S rRNA (cytidine2498-2'-O)-methyltransferase